MTAEDHLKIAANELQKAADAVKLDTSQLRNDLNTFKQSSTTQLAGLTDELRIVQQQQGKVGDPSQKTQLNQRMTQLRRQISDKQREMSDEIQRMTDLIHRRERDVGALIQQSRLVAPF